jgi:protein gp37
MGKCTLCEVDMAQTTIEWTATIHDGITIPGYTFNSWHGCTKISRGCEKCYALTLSKRWGRDIWGPKADRLFMSDSYWKQPLRWNKQAEQDGVRRKVFCASMADVFEEHMVPEIDARMDEERMRLWQLIVATPMLDWLLLTKRPEHILRMIPFAWTHEAPHNVWYGTSTENQEQANKRIPELLKVPAVVRFLSAEPLLGPIDLHQAVGFDVVDVSNMTLEEFRAARAGQRQRTRIDWLIAGAESGPGARPMEHDWVRSLRDQCLAGSVAFFYKQDAVGGKKTSSPLLDGKVWSQFPEVRR